jgi:tetratricopeptide (TPR) repeat protein
LRHAHLVRPAGPDRWSLHDLIRAHIGTRTPHRLGPDQLRVAETRLLRHYITTTDQADQHVQALPGQAVPERFTGREDALDWLDAERANLIATVAHAATTGHHTHSAHLSLALAGYLQWRRDFADWVTVATHAHTSATHLTQRHHAFAANNLGVALRRVRRAEEAIAFHQVARLLFHGLRDRHREAMAWNNLGLALRGVERLEDAIAAHHHARTLYQELGDRHREGGAWDNLGLALREAERLEDAIAAHHHARTLFHELGDRHREVMAWINLGGTLHQMRRFEEAIAAHHHARTLSHELGDRHREAMAWSNLGSTLDEVERFDDAAKCWHQAQTLFTETDDPANAELVASLLRSLPPSPEQTTTT